LSAGNLSAFIFCCGLDLGKGSIFWGEGSYRWTGPGELTIQKWTTNGIKFHSLNLFPYRFLSVWILRGSLIFYHFQLLISIDISFIIVSMLISRKLNKCRLLSFSW
jgi:hypothetical protein